MVFKRRRWNPKRDTTVDPMDHDRLLEVGSLSSDTDDEDTGNVNESHVNDDFVSPNSISAAQPRLSTPIRHNVDYQTPIDCVPVTHMVISSNRHDSVNSTPDSCLNRTPMPENIELTPSNLRFATPNTTNQMVTSKSSILDSRSSIFPLNRTPMTDNSNAADQTPIDCVPVTHMVISSNRHDIVNSTPDSCLNRTPMPENIELTPSNLRFATPNTTNQMVTSKSSILDSGSSIFPLNRTPITNNSNVTPHSLLSGSTSIAQRSSDCTPRSNLPGSSTSGNSARCLKRKLLVSLKPLSKYVVGSVNYLNQRYKRRKYAKTYSTKRYRRNENRTNYSKSSESINDSKRARYENSPGYVGRILDNMSRLYAFSEPFRRRKMVNCITRYHTVSPYAKSAKQRASASIKAKYSLFSPYRRKLSHNVKIRRSMHRSSATRKLVRQYDRKLYERHKDKLTAKRKITYIDPTRRKAVKDRNAKFMALKRKYTKMKQQSNTFRKSYVTNVRSIKHNDVALILERKKRLENLNAQPVLPRLKKGTLQYKKMMYNRWKRYKVNQLLSYFETSQSDSIKSTKERQLYERRKLEVTQLLEQVLVWQKDQRKELYKVCSKITSLYNAAETECEKVTDADHPECLTTYYGNFQYHVCSQESMEIDKSKYTYKPFFDVFPDAQNASKKRKNVFVRLCDESCQPLVTSNWSFHLHKELGKINSNLFIQQLLHNIYVFEECTNCNIMQELCNTELSCSDLVCLLIKLRPHYSGIRALINDIYLLRKVALELHSIELLLFCGTYTDFVACRATRFQERANGTTSTENIDFATDRHILQTFGKFVTAFKTGVTDSMELEECCCCLRLVTSSEIIVFNELDDPFLQDPVVKSNIQFYTAHWNKQLPVIKICVKCKANIKNKKLLTYGYRNSMWPSPVPPQLKRLNVYERYIISLCKSYQRIVKLKPCRYRGPSNTLVRAIKGLSIHLPLPTGTVKTVSSTLNETVTLPDCSNLLIQVDAMPNLSKKMIFRSLIDFSNVTEALKWLKENNHLYSNVVIDESFALLNEPTLPYVLNNPDATYNDEDDDLDDIYIPNKRKAKPRQPSFFDTATGVDDEAGDDIDLNNPNDVVATSNVVTSTLTVPTNAPDSGSKGNNVTTSNSNVTLDTDTNKLVTSITEQGNNVNDSVNGKNVVFKSRSEVASDVKGLKLPIPYSVPYKSFLFDQLRDPSTALMHVPEDEVLEEFSVIQMEKSLPKKADLELFAMKPLLSKPISWDDPYCDVASFPCLYPYGKFGLVENRLQVVTPAYFMEHQLRLSDPRFRRDLAYVFDCAIRKDMMAINGSIYTMLNCGRCKKVNVGQLKKGMQDPDNSGLLERNLTTMLGMIVGTPQYWLKVKHDLEAVIQQFGPATFFLTVTCAEYKMNDFKEFLILRNFDLDNVHNTDSRNLASIDPVSVSLHFNKRFMVFWDSVIMKEDGPLGCVEHFYIKKEYQQRGAPHMHILLWIKGAPVHGKDKDDIVIGYIEKHISCAIPDPIESPLLHELVIGNQMHKCTSSCKRVKSIKGKNYWSFCRYGYPREVAVKARLNTTEQVLAAKVTGTRRKKLYTLRRKPTEIMVNDYNPALLLMWGANIDIQFIDDVNMTLTYYTTGYVCKAEKQMMSKVADMTDSVLSAAGMAKSMLCKMLSSRQLGSQEAADKVLRFPMYKLSEVVKSPALFLPGEQKRRLKTKKQLDGLPDDSEDVYCNNFQTTYYPQRPEAMNNMCAYDVLSWYELKYGKPIKENPLYMPSCNTYFAKRRTEAVVRTWQVRKKDPVSLERYCFQLIALFKPWRKEEDLLTDMDGNIKSSYVEVVASIRGHLVKLDRYDAAKQRFHAMIEWAEQFKRDVQVNLENNIDKDMANILKCGMVDTAQDLDTELIAQSNKIKAKLSQQMVTEEYENLNSLQRKAFDTIINAIKARDADQTIDPKRLFVSGVGGTGKSFLIMALRHYLEFYYSTDTEPAVLVAAPTGVAAINVDGVTIHKLLKLPVQKSSQSGQSYWALHAHDAKLMRMVFRKAKLLIIDEVSMISNLTLMIIHKRLNEILIDEDKDPLAMFGNVHMLLLGDLLQLPPVNAPHVFSFVTRKDIMTNFKSIGIDLKLWQLFEFLELTENMRQRDDCLYADMLARIRIGSPTESDIEQLKSRMVISGVDNEPEWADIIEASVAKFIDLFAQDEYILCLMPKNVFVNEFNLRVLEILQLQPTTCKAIDTVDVTSGATYGRRPKNKKGKQIDLLAMKTDTKLSVADTGGLEEQLVIAVGARVMLRKNIDVKLKLVNGSIGFIRRIDINPDTNKTEIIHVAFQDIDELTLITKMSAKYCIGSGIFVERVQFPLTLAYAITIHKCQGLSLATAMIDIGHDAFSDGMAYVALSRVKKLNNVHLIRFSGYRVKCDGRCVKEYNRLSRQSVNCDQIKDYNCNPEFVAWEKKVRMSVNDQKDMLLEEVDRTVSLVSGSKQRALVANKKKSKKSNQMVTSVLHSGEYLKFTNDDGHSCFANATAQCLLRCTHFYDKLVAHSHGDPIAEALLELFNMQRAGSSNDLTTYRLRQAFGSNSQFAVTSQLDCDAAEFITDILTALPAEVTTAFSCTTTVTGPCISCGEMNVLHSPTTSVVIIGLAVDYDDYSLNSIFCRDEEIYRSCFKCHYINPTFAFKTDYVFAPSNRYLVLNCPVLQGGQPIDRVLLGCRENNLLLFGHRWNIIACAHASGYMQRSVNAKNKELIGEDQQRHFKSYVQHQQKEWICLNDTYQNINKHKPLFKHMCVLILERIIG